MSEQNSRACGPSASGEFQVPSDEVIFPLFDLRPLAVYNEKETDFDL